MEKGSGLLESSSRLTTHLSVSPPTAWISTSSFFQLLSGSEPLFKRGQVPLRSYFLHVPKCLICFTANPPVLGCIDHLTAGMPRGMGPPRMTDALLGMMPVIRVFGSLWGSGALVLESLKVPWVHG